MDEDIRARLEKLTNDTAKDLSRISVLRKHYGVCEKASCETCYEYLIIDEKLQNMFDDCLKEIAEKELSTGCG